MFNSELYSSSNNQPNNYPRNDYVGKIRIAQITLNGLELLILALGLIILVSSSTWGVLVQSRNNNDKQREFDISQVVIPALQDFYKNSASEENARKYPLSGCSLNLNEVDYEWTLANALGGNTPKLDNWVYIPTNKFPKDASGEYSDTLASRKIAYRCPNNLNSETLSDKTQRIYKNSTSCNFSRDNSKYRYCYLYRSNTNGDNYSLAYFSQSKNCYVIFDQFRNQKVSVSQECK